MALDVHGPWHSSNTSLPPVELELAAEVDPVVVVIESESTSPPPPLEDSVEAEFELEPVPLAETAPELEPERPRVLEPSSSVVEDVASALGAPYR